MSNSVVPDPELPYLYGHSLQSLLSFPLVVVYSFSTHGSNLALCFFRFFPPFFLFRLVSQSLTGPWLDTFLGCLANDCIKQFQPSITRHSVRSGYYHVLPLMQEVIILLLLAFSFLFYYSGMHTCMLQHLQCGRSCRAIYWWDTLLHVD